MTFIFLGNKLPEYAVASIELAKKFSGAEIELIGNRKFEKHVANTDITFVHVEKFYDVKEFQEVKDKITFSHEFRNGFWLKTLERFFVLEQYMQFENLGAVLHAELDQVIFRIDKLVANLASLNHKGLFLPFNSPDVAVASVLYCNNSESLRSFIDFSKSRTNFRNEMELLAEWSKNNSDHAFALPTLASKINSELFRNNLSCRLLDESETGGIVDPAQLGQWIGGNDPRNEILTRTPKNKFVEVDNLFLLTKNYFENLSFVFDLKTNTLKANYDHQFLTNVYNLHLHSKIHKWLLDTNEPIQKLLWLANLDEPIALPYSRKIQIKYRISYFLSETILAIRRNPRKILSIPERLFYFLNYFFRVLLVSMFSKLGVRKSSKPFLSGDTFRKYADFVYESETKILDHNKIKNGDVIFCQSDLISSFNENFLRKNTKAINLVFGNSDVNFDKKLTHNLILKNVSRVFAQNLTEPIDKFHILPIGLENAWHAKNGIVLGFRFRRIFKYKKIYKVGWSFKIENNRIERKQAADFLSNSKNALYLGTLSSFKHKKALAKLAFVASPPGNGLDCHRTWEAMYLKCVPIVKRSYMTEEYEKLGLPVWIIDSFEELKNLDEHFLRKKYEEIKPKFNSEVLWFKYWEDKLKVTS